MPPVYVQLRLCCHSRIVGNRKPRSQRAMSRRDNVRRGGGYRLKIRVGMCAMRETSHILLSIQVGPRLLDCVHTFSPHREHGPQRLSILWGRTFPRWLSQRPRSRSRTVRLAMPDAATQDVRVQGAPTPQKAQPQRRWFPEESRQTPHRHSAPPGQSDAWQAFLVLLPPT